MSACVFFCPILNLCKLNNYLVVGIPFIDMEILEAYIVFVCNLSVMKKANPSKSRRELFSKSYNIICFSQKYLLILSYLRNSSCLTHCMPHLKSIQKIISQTLSKHAKDLVLDIAVVWCRSSIFLLLPIYQLLGHTLLHTDTKSRSTSSGRGRRRSRSRRRGWSKNRDRGRRRNGSRSRN